MPQTKSTVVKKPRKKPVPKAAPAHDDIAKKAYEIYEQKGRPEGKDIEHWIEAEKMLKGRKSRKKAS